MIVRVPKAAELAEIVALETKCFPDPWELATVSDPNLAKLVIQDGVEDNTILGYSLGRNQIDFYDLYRIGVHPSYRKSGVASRLLAGLINQVEQRILVEVREDNQAAIRLYQKHNFVQIDRRPRYYQPADVAALILARQP